MDVKVQRVAEKKAIKWLFAVSGLALTCLLLTYSSFKLSVVSYAVEIPVAMFVWYYIAVKKDFLASVFRKVDRHLFVFTFITSVSALYAVAKHSLPLRIAGKLMDMQKSGQVSRKFSVLPAFLKDFVLSHFEELCTLAFIAVITAACFAFAALFVCLYKVWSVLSDRLTAEIAKADKTEKVYFIVTFLVFSVTIIALFSRTDMFSDAASGKACDILYGSDTVRFLERSTNGSCVFRRALFQVLYLPVYSVIFPLSKAMFFQPRAIYFLIQIVHAAMLIACTVLQGRMLRLNGISKCAYFMISTAVYPFMIYAVNIEQYVLAVFILNLFIYSYIEGRESKYNLYIASVGSLITTGVLVPLIFKGKNIKEVILHLFSMVLKTIGVFSVFGGLTALADMRAGLFGSLGKYGGVEITLSEKLLHFIHFAGECLIAPAGFISTKVQDADIYMTYCETPAAGVDVFGLIVLLLCAAGFIVSRKERFSQICGGWILFSYMLIGVLGWGSGCETFLYSVYFGWAYIALLFVLAEKLLAKAHRFVKIGVYGAAAVALAAVNIPAFIKVIQFGITYYPVR